MSYRASPFNYDALREGLERVFGIDDILIHGISVEQAETHWFGGTLRSRVTSKNKSFDIVCMLAVGEFAGSDGVALLISESCTPTLDDAHQTYDARDFDELENVVVVVLKQGDDESLDSYRECNEYGCVGERTVIHNSYAALEVPDPSFSDYLRFFVNEFSPIRPSQPVVPGL